MPQIDQRQTFTYLHQNLANNGDFANEIVKLQTMPILKNITSSNLIPVVDFEKLQNKESISSGIEISYLVTYVSSCLQTMSKDSSSSALFVIPSQPTDEILFKPYPQNRQIDLSLVKRYLSKENTQNGNGSSIKPKGDIQSSPQNSPNQSEPDSPTPPLTEKDIQKQILSKHGWKIMMIQLVESTYVRTSENRRATQLLQLSRA